MRKRTKKELKTTGWEWVVIFIPGGTRFADIGKTSQLAVKMLEIRGDTPTRVHQLKADNILKPGGEGYGKRTSTHSSWIKQAPECRFSS